MHTSFSNWGATGWLLAEARCNQISGPRFKKPLGLQMYLTKGAWLAQVGS